MPFFSVIIPLYNKESYIEDCLLSVLNQSFNDFEVIITNDGSTDNSLCKVKSIQSDKIQIIDQKNLGVSLARNNASAKASGIYLAFLDADDIWKKDHLHCLAESIKVYPKSNFFANNYWIKYSDSYSAPAKIDINSTNDKPIVIQDLFGSSLHNNIIWTSAACLNREAFFKYGQFNPEYTTGQDLDLWIRIGLKEPLIFNPKKTMIYNYALENSLGKSEQNLVRLKLFSSFKDNEKLNPSLKQYLDIKRYGLALRTKINGETEIFHKVRSDISKENLNFKQNLLLKTPRIILRLLNKARPFLLKNSWYLKLFKS